MTQSNAQSESPENLKKIYGARFLGAPSLSQRSLADSDQSRRAPSQTRYKQSRRPSLSLQQDETPARKPIEWRRTRVSTGSHVTCGRRAVLSPASGSRAAPQPPRCHKIGRSSHHLCPDNPIYSVAVGERLFWAVYPTAMSCRCTEIGRASCRER